MVTIDLLVFCSVIVLLIAIGMKKVKSESTYLFADRNIAWLPLTATLVMTEFNGATLISFSSLGYLAGFRALTLPFVFLFGLLFYALIVAKKWKSFNGMSVAGFFRQRYGRNLGVFTSALLLIAMLGFNAVFIKSLTLLFQPLFPSINHWIISSSLLAIIFCMSLRGGLIAVIRTDLLSLILMLLFFPSVAFFMWSSSTVPTPLAPISHQHSSRFGQTLFPDVEETEEGRVKLTLPRMALKADGNTDGQSGRMAGEKWELDQSHELLPFRFVFSLIVLTMFTYIVAPWYGQKIFSAKSEKVAFWATVTAAIFVFLLYGSAILATAFFKYRGFESPTAELAFPCLINDCLPTGFKGFGFALLFASSATTLTGSWSAMAAMWIGDFLKSPSDQGCRLSILVTASFAILSYFLSNTLIDKVFEKMILANIPVAALSFGLLAGFYWKKVSYIGVLISIFMGCLCGVGSYCIFGEARCYTWYWAVYGIPIIFLSGFIGSLIFQERRRLKYF